MTTVRQHLLDTLADLRDREKPMEIDRARAVADVARVLVDSAKVEVDFIRASGGDATSEFIQPDAAKPALPAGITGIHRHVLK
jgi:hypothetical protein